MNKKEISARIITRDGAHGVFSIDMTFTRETLGFSLINLHKDCLSEHTNAEFELLRDIIYAIQDDPACQPAAQRAVDNFNSRKAGRVAIPDPGKCLHLNTRNALRSYNYGHCIEAQCLDCWKNSVKKNKIENQPYDFIKELQNDPSHLYITGFTFTDNYYDHVESTRSSKPPGRRRNS